MTIVRPLDLDTLTLATGSHSDHNAMCIMEAVAYIAGEPWTDHPACASPIIGAFLRSWNDTLHQADRDRLLKPFVARLVGTAGTPEQEDRRGWLCLDWLVRSYTPVWLRAAGLNAQADLLADLVEFTPGAAAWDAAWDALKPYVEELQTSALDLLERMLAVTA